MPAIRTAGLQPAKYQQQTKVGVIPEGNKNAQPEKIPVTHYLVTDGCLFSQQAADSFFDGVGCAFGGVCSAFSGVRGGSADIFERITGNCAA